jgi:hypothetical protein
MINLDYIIENDSCVVCPLLPADSFISYCVSRGIRTSKDQLEQFEKLGVFYPIARVNYPKIKLKIEYVDGGQRIRDLGVLKDGEDWSGDTQEVCASLPFDKKDIKNWQEEGVLWDPKSRSFEDWKHFIDEEGKTKIESFYSIFQCYTLYKIFQSTRIELGAELWATDANEEVNKFIAEVSKWAKIVISDHQKNRTTIEAAAHICQVISNRYFPETQSDRRTIRISGYYHHRDWEEYRRKWNPRSVLTDIGISTEKLRHLQERVAIDARFTDPLEHWYGLISFVSLDQKERLKNKALLAQTLYSMEYMLRLFYKDIAGDELPEPDELQERWKDRFYGDGVIQNELQYLEFLTNQYHLNPRPNLILVVEGDGETEQFPRLAKELLGYSFPRLGIETVNLQGFGNFVGKKRGTKDKYGALERFIDAYHNRQTIVFIVLDNEDRVPKIKEVLTKARSKYYPKRRVTINEYIHVWKRNIEFDNFSHDEIAQAMTKLGKYKYSFQPSEIADCEFRWGTPKKHDMLSELFEKKLKRGLEKPKLLELLFQFITSDPEKELGSAGKGKRPVVQLMRKIMKLAARNYQPITLRSWKETQESGYLGEPIK